MRERVGVGKRDEDEEEKRERKESGQSTLIKYRFLTLRTLRTFLHFHFFVLIKFKRVFERDAQRQWGIYT